MLLSAGLGAARSETRLHFAANANVDAKGVYQPGRIGFNLADVKSRQMLDSLPAGVRGLAWIGLCSGVDREFLNAVQPYRGATNLFGFYLMDDPDPTGWYSKACAAGNLKAESDWIHANIPHAKTFIVLMNLGWSWMPSFARSYNPANSHVDLFGISPYPCRTELKGCDFDMIGRYFAAAKASGVPEDKLVPIFQVFGGGSWRDDSGGRYILPTVAEEREIIARWDAVLPDAAFDYAYSWGAQRGDTALQYSSALRSIFLHRNMVE